MLYSVMNFSSYFLQIFMDWKIQYKLRIRLFLKYTIRESVSGQEFEEKWFSVVFSLLQSSSLHNVVSRVKRRTVPINLPKRRSTTLLFIAIYSIMFRGASRNRSGRLAISRGELRTRFHYERRAYVASRAPLTIYPAHTSEPGGEMQSIKNYT